MWGGALAQAALLGSRRRITLVLAGALVAGLTWAAIVASAEPFVDASLGPGHDAVAYWGAAASDPYARSSLAEHGAYLYSPAFLQALAPLRALPWQGFEAAWTALLLATTLFLSGPYLLAAVTALVFLELWGGNVHLLLAAAIVLGFRWPAAWAFVLLTKVTPGVGLLWFALRREWRHLAVALAATVAIGAVSLLLAPRLWADWLAVLTGNVGAGTLPASIPIPLAVRLPVAVAVIAWGAIRGRAWALPVGCLVALPVVWFGSLSVLVAVLPLRRLDLGPRPATRGAPRHRRLVPAA